MDSIENEEKKSIMNLSEILHKRAIKLTLRHQTTLKHCATADSRYFNQLNHTRLGKSVILTSILKSPAIPLQWSKLVLMFLLSKEQTWGIGIRTLYMTFCLYVYITSPLID